MLLHIPNVLTPGELNEMREALGRADWTDGRETVGAQGAQVKRNEQLPEASPVRHELGATVLAARLLARWRLRAAPREAIPATFFTTSSLLATAAILRVERHHRGSRDCDRTGFFFILRRVETRAKR